MEALALLSHLFHFVVAGLAVYFCAKLFLHHRARGWLLLGAVFLEPFVRPLIRAASGRPLLPYKSVTPSTDGILHVNYKMDFQFLYLISVIGLFLLFRDSRKKPQA
jgi:hypothetical protein